MWPSERLASISLDSWLGVAQARRRDRWGIRPIVTLLEGRALLSTVPITVTSLADSGTGTLRAAITTADAGSASNQYAIGFASGLTGTMNLTEALPTLSNNISITGPGAPNLLTVNRVSTDADFSIFTVNSGTTVSISGINITGGNSTNGGGINNSNGTPYSGGMLTVTNSTFNGDTASESGGGIFNAGTLTVTNSTFNGDTAYEGSGIYNSGLGGAVTVTNSTFTSNAGGYGGIFSDGGALTVTNSTFTSNSDGGIDNDGGTLTVNNTIIAGNVGDDIYGSIQSTSSNNLIGNGAGITDLSSLNSTNLIGTASNQ